MKPVWCTRSPKTVPNTSRVVTFKWVLCLLLSKLAERRNQPRGVSKACQRKTLSALSSKPLFLLIRLLNSLSSYIFRSLIISGGHLFLINMLLSLRAAGRTQPVGEERNPPLCVCAGGSSETNTRSWTEKHGKITKAMPGRESRTAHRADCCGGHLQKREHGSSAFITTEQLRYQHLKINIDAGLKAFRPQAAGSNLDPSHICSACHQEKQDLGFIAIDGTLAAPDTTVVLSDHDFLSFLSSSLP